MLERLRIKNFKAWRDTGDIELAPITIFFGTNSSGKTSLTQLLLLLQQTAQSSDRRRVLHLGDQHSTIELGTFSDIVHDHDKRVQLEFELGWRAPSRVEIKDPRSERRIASDSLTFRAAVQQVAQGKLSLARMDYRLTSDTDTLEIGMRRKDGGNLEVYELTKTNYKPIRNQGRKWPLPPPTRFYGFPDEAIAYYQNTAFLADLNLEFESLLSRVYYVGPLREYPQRLYQWSGEEPLHVDVTGARAIEALLAGQHRRMNRKPKEPLQDFPVIVARWLKQMKLIEAFEVRPIARGRTEYEVILRTIGARAEVKLTDVGFGISQVLPVIVECFYVKANSIVIFEQPEIHLHPSVQADLADLFIEAIETRENGRSRNTQFIIESHSEHFLRRLQRRVAEGAIAHDAVAMYFCEASQEGSTIRRLELDRFGRIANWPKHFFGDMIGDTAAQVRSAIDHMKQASDG
jgi:predicted ATPase